MFRFASSVLVLVALVFGIGCGDDSSSFSDACSAMIAKVNECYAEVEAEAKRLHGQDAQLNVNTVQQCIDSMNASDLSADEAMAAINQLTALDCEQFAEAIAPSIPYSSARLRTDASKTQAILFSTAIRIE